MIAARAHLGIDLVMGALEMDHAADQAVLFGDADPGEVEFVDHRVEVHVFPARRQPVHQTLSGPIEAGQKSADPIKIGGMVIGSRHTRKLHLRASDLNRSQYLREHHGEGTLTVHIAVRQFAPHQPCQLPRNGQTQAD